MEEAGEEEVIMEALRLLVVRNLEGDMALVAIGACPLLLLQIEMKVFVERRLHPLGPLRNIPIWLTRRRQIGDVLMMMAHNLLPEVTGERPPLCRHLLKDLLCSARMRHWPPTHHLDP